MILTDNRNKHVNRVSESSISRVFETVIGKKEKENQEIPLISMMDL